MSLEMAIARCIAYAKMHLHLQEEDEIYVENLLLKRFHLTAPYEGEVDEEEIAAMKVPDEILKPLKEALLQEEEEPEADRDLIWVMGLLTPMPSEVTREFQERYRVNPRLATDFLYDLSIKNDYIAKTAVDRNIVFPMEFPEGSALEISINLSKPEKNNKDIAKLVGAVSSSYPKCALCRENLGFEGNARKPARENIRFVPLNLDGERWFLQYSPYVYFDQHCIVFYEKHVPMEMSPRIFRKLFAFVDLFPHYFIGSNSDLPIVGGSILNHEHFQGGAHELPLLKAKALREIPIHAEGVKLEEVDFYDTALRFSGKDKDAIIEAASKVLAAWRVYDDPSREILSHDEQGQHSTCTPFVQKKGDVYVMHLVLRNNRCNEKYPGGIFHAHPEYAHIKHEGIGLIEAAGLFILPARLVRQSKEVEDVAAKRLRREDYLKLYPDLDIFSDMIEKVEGGMGVREYLGEVCRLILNNVAVFKHDPDGEKGLQEFLQSVNL